MRLKSPERRQQIVQAALALLATTPIERLSTRDVARRVGVSQPALFRHFRSRDHILEAVVEHTQAELGELASRALDPAASPLAVIDGLVRGLLAHLALHPGMPRILFHVAAGDGSTRTHEKIRQLIAAQHALLSELLASARRAGEVSAPLDVERAAWILVAMIQGAALHRAEGGPRVLGEDELLAFWRAGLTGAASRAPEISAPAPLPAIVSLDVRPILASGAEPLPQILATLERLPDDGVLVLDAPFEPKPLVALLRRRGARVDVHAYGARHWALWVRPARAPEIQDLRELEAPGPLEHVLRAASRLAPGAALIAWVPRVPRLLLPRLDERGFGWSLHETPDGTALVHVRRPA